MSAATTLELRRCLRRLQISCDALVTALADSGVLREFAGDERLLPRRLPRLTSPVPAADRLCSDDGAHVVVAHQRVRGLRRAYGLLVVEPGLALDLVYERLEIAAEEAEEILLLGGW